jgi:hypothetical protein
MASQTSRGIFLARGGSLLQSPPFLLSCGVAVLNGVCEPFRTLNFLCNLFLQLFFIQTSALVLFSFTALVLS